MALQARLVVTQKRWSVQEDALKAGRPARLTGGPYGNPRRDVHALARTLHRHAEEQAVKPPKPTDEELAEWKRVREAWIRDGCPPIRVGWRTRVIMWYDLLRFKLIGKNYWE